MGGGLFYQYYPMLLFHMWNEFIRAKYNVLRHVLLALLKIKLLLPCSFLRLHDVSMSNFHQYAFLNILVIFRHDHFRFYLNLYGLSVYWIWLNHPSCALVVAQYIISFSWHLKTMLKCCSHFVKNVWYRKVWSEMARNAIETTDIIPAASQWPACKPFGDIPRAAFDLSYNRSFYWYIVRLHSSRVATRP